MNIRIFTLLVLTVSAHSAIVAETIPAISTLELPAIYEESGVRLGGQIEADSAVSLSDALQLVLSHHPQILAAQSQIASARGRLQQSVSRPNPELSVEIEDFGRSEEAAPAQTTIGIEQSFELFGKRGARRAVAEAELSSERFAAQQSLLELYETVAATFIAALGAEENVTLARQRLELAGKIEEVVRMKVADGAVPKAEFFRAQAATKLSEIDLAASEAASMRERLALANLWGSVDTNFHVDGKLDAWLTIPLSALQKLTVDDNPEVTGLQAQIRAREADIRLASVTGKPDVSLGAGYRRLHDDASNAFLVWAAVPLPLFDRNHGGIAEATANLSLAEAGLASTRQRLEGEIRRQLAVIESMRKQIEMIREQVIPPAQQAMEETDLAYRLGSQPFINVLDAQRTVSELQGMLIDALIAGAQATVEIEKLTGHRLNPVGR